MPHAENPKANFPRLSVVVTYFNKGEAVVSAVTSAISQMKPHDELVIVDDCSDDDFAKKAHNLAEQAGVKSELLRLEKNLGAAAAKNAGIGLASGDAVVLLDGDDLLTPDSLPSARVAMLQSPDADFFFGGYEIRTIETGESRVEMCRNLVDGSGMLNPHSLISNWTLLGCSIFRRSFFERFELFDPSGPRTDDIDMFSKALAAGARGAYIDRVIYIWNKSSDGNNSGIPPVAMLKSWRRRRHFFRRFLSPFPYLVKEIRVHMRFLVDVTQSRWRSLSARG